MATGFTITVNTLPGYTFVGPTFTADIWFNPNGGLPILNNQIFTVDPMDSTKATFTCVGFIPADSYIIMVKILSTAAIAQPPPPNGTSVANFQVSFTSSPPL